MRSPDEIITSTDNFFTEESNECVVLQEEADRLEEELQDPTLTLKMQLRIAAQLRAIARSFKSLNCVAQPEQ
jgi:hypothetical protein